MYSWYFGPFLVLITSAPQSASLGPHRCRLLRRFGAQRQAAEGGDVGANGGVDTYMVVSINGGNPWFIMGNSG